MTKRAKAGSKARAASDQEMKLFRHVVKEATPMIGMQVLFPDHSELRYGHKDIAPPSGHPKSMVSKHSHHVGLKPAVPRRHAPEIDPSIEGDLRHLDGRTGQRFKRGKVEIEGTIDLHGMTQAQAHGALQQFITQAYARKKRCILVITGKGGKANRSDFGYAQFSTGVLRERTPQWLSEPALAHKVVAFHPAQQRDGGSGAYYVYLRQKRGH